MSLNKRLGVESMVVTLLLAMLLIGWNIIQGMLTTYKHVPELTSINSSDVTIQSQVQFGAVTSWNGPGMMVVVAAFILFAVVYYVIRSKFGNGSSASNQ